VLATVLVVVVAGVVALTLTHRSPGGSATASHSSDSSSATPGHPAAVKIADVTDFDPQGNPPRENPDQARLAHDGDPDTAWETSTYYGNPRLGGLKSGVGLLLDLGRKAQVGQVRVRLKGRPTSLELLAAPPGATSAPTSTHGMSKLAAVQHAGTDVDLTVKKPVTTHWLVVWLTSLPAVPGGYQGKVAEVSVRS
jgi:putative peptidoglycan lipid II flippase